MWFSFVLLTYLYQDAWFRKRRVLLTIVSIDCSFSCIFASVSQWEVTIKDTLIVSLTELLVLCYVSDCEFQVSRSLE